MKISAHRATLAGTYLVVLLGCAAGCASGQLVARPAQARALEIHVGPVSVMYAADAQVKASIEQAVTRHASASSTAASGAVRAHLVTLVDRDERSEAVPAGPRGETNVFEYTNYMVSVLLVDERGTKLGSARFSIDEQPGFGRDPRREVKVLTEGTERALDAMLPPGFARQAVLARAP